MKKLEKNQTKEKQTDIDNYIRDLVIARIEASSDNLKIMIGSQKELTRQELIDNVREGNEIGKEIIDLQLEFLRDMAEGKVYQNE